MVFESLSVLTEMHKKTASLMPCGLGDMFPPLEAGALPKPPRDESDAAAHEAWAAECRKIMADWYESFRDDVRTLAELFPC